VKTKRASHHLDKKPSKFDFMLAKRGQVYLPMSGKKITALLGKKLNGVVLGV